MPSPIAGVWELVSDTEKAFAVTTETHQSVVFERTQVRRGIIATYTLEGNRVQSTLLVDTAVNAPPSAALEFQRDGDTITTTLATPGRVSPAGHIDRWRKLADSTMTSSLAGVWELVSDTEKAISIVTDTHFCAVIERTNVRRGIAGTYTITGTRIRYHLAVDTAVNAPAQLEADYRLDGKTMTLTLISGGTVSPTGHVDRWRKIA